MEDVNSKDTEPIEAHAKHCCRPIKANSLRSVALFCREGPPHSNSMEVFSRLGQATSELLIHPTISQAEPKQTGKLLPRRVLEKELMQLTNKGADIGRNRQLHGSTLSHGGSVNQQTDFKCFMPQAGHLPAGGAIGITELRQRLAKAEANVTSVENRLT